MLKLGGLALPALFLTGCPPNVFGECQFLNDCPGDQQCQDGRCVDVNVLPPITPVTPGSDGGPNGPGVTLEIETRDLNEESVIDWMEPDPRAGGQVMFGEYEQNNFDLLRVFGLNDANFVPAFEIDFNEDLGGCNLDTLTIQFLDQNEIWLQCRVGAPVRLLNANDLTQSYDPPNVSVQLVYATAGVQDVPRRLVSSRGASAFTSWQINDREDALDVRLTDTIDPSLSFSSIVSYHPIAAGNVPGDHVLIFDRGRNTLVPITLNGTNWETSPNLLPYQIPVGASAVVFLDTVNANGNPNNAGEPNFAAIYPAEGRIRFFNFEEQVELDDPGTLFEPNVAFLGQPPSTAARILLAKTPSGEAVMFASQNAQRVYRIPLRPDADDEVRSYDLEPLDRRVSGMVVASEDEVWLSYGTDPAGPAIERVTIDEIP